MILNEFWMFPGCSLATERVGEWVSEQGNEWMDWWMTADLICAWPRTAPVVCPIMDWIDDISVPLYVASPVLGILFTRPLTPPPLSKSRRRITLCRARIVLSCPPAPWLINTTKVVGLSKLNDISWVHGYPRNQCSYISTHPPTTDRNT